ncbi:MAG: hypothetical protein RML45_13470 [Acetobacteraceae bacterium]|nr:hypothetical protein [Acetobacteraceae bacterium]
MAIVLPNGPEMAAAFLAVATAATTAPLNPAYREDEFAFYLEDLAREGADRAEGGGDGGAGGGGAARCSGAGTGARRGGR